MKKYLLYIMAALMLMGCGEATGEESGLSNKEIKCYSGGILIYSGYFIGDISSDMSTDNHTFANAYTFVDDSGRLMALSGDCIINFD